MDMKKIDGVWHRCVDGWVYREASEEDIIRYLFDMSMKEFKAFCKSPFPDDFYEIGLR